jgi:hypothetical protein
LLEDAQRQRSACCGNHTAIAVRRLDQSDEMVTAFFTDGECDSTTAAAQFVEGLLVFSRHVPLGGAHFCFVCSLDTQTARSVIL